MEIFAPTLKDYSQNLSSTPVNSRSYTQHGKMHTVAVCKPESIFAIIFLPISGSNTRRGDTLVPTYGYRCNNCDHEFEVVQKITEEPIKECEKCKGEVRRLLYPVGIVFKGSGFHINDYRKESKPSETTESTPTPAAKS